MRNQAGRSEGLFLTVIQTITGIVGQNVIEILDVKALSIGETIHPVENKFEHPIIVIHTGANRLMRT